MKHLSLHLASWIFFILILLLFTVGTYAQKLAPESHATSSFAIDAGGNLYAWGFNGNGQLGDGTLTTRQTPINISFPAGVTAWTAITGGFSHTLAIGNDNNLYSWGSNSNGQLGLGDPLTSYSSPQKVPYPTGVTGWTAVVAGAYYSLAVGNDGNLYSWGSNVYGQLGIGNTTDQHSPTKVTLPSGVTSWTTVIGAGAFNSIAVGNDNNIYAWGWYGYGELPLGPLAANQTTPAKVTYPGGVTGWIAAAGGNLYTVAIGNDGNLYTCGYNTNGQLGLGNKTSYNTFQKVPLPSLVTSWTAVACGVKHTLAIGSDGNLYSCGANSFGQLGIGNTTDASSFQKVTLPSGVTSWRAIAAGDSFSVAISNNNNVYTCGKNSAGQLGINNTTNQSNLVEVLGVGGIGNLALPVELSTFTSSVNNGAVELSWETKTEVNNYGFEIERAEVNEGSSPQFFKIGFAKGYGNSSSPKQYSFIDKEISFGTYSYRLKVIDNNGQFKYSNIVNVNAGEMPNGFMLSQNYPNPFNPSTQIKFGFNNNTKATLTVYNVLGEKVSELFNGVAQAGQYYNVTFNGSIFASGIYYYNLQSENHTVVKKMLMMK